MPVTLKFLLSRRHRVAGGRYIEPKLGWEILYEEAVFRRARTLMMDILNSDKWPVILDFVEDRSRW